MHYSTLGALAATRHADLMHSACLERVGAFAIGSDAPRRHHPWAGWVSSHLIRRHELSAPCVSC